ENKLKEENTEFAQYSLANLAQLKKDYSIQYKQNFE
ncbi:kinase, partial [Staphylococcus ureilyticus]|nr:kinase [Staphylococcus ureilyticus]